MTEETNRRIRCPHFRKKWGKVIGCEGWMKGTTVHINFEETGAQLDYMEDFCFTDCWRGCQIAQMAEEANE